MNVLLESFAVFKVISCKSPPNLHSPQEAIIVVYMFLH